MTTKEQPKSSKSVVTQVEQRSYEMPPKEGFSIAHFLTVADISRSAQWYAKVFDSCILSSGDGESDRCLRQGGPGRSRNCV